MKFDYSVYFPYATMSILLTVHNHEMGGSMSARGVLWRCAGSTTRDIRGLLISIIFHQKWQASCTIAIFTSLKFVEVYRGIVLVNGEAYFLFVFEFNVNCWLTVWFNTNIFDLFCCCFLGLYIRELCSWKFCLFFFLLWLHLASIWICCCCCFVHIVSSPWTSSTFKLTDAGSPLSIREEKTHFQSTAF